MSTIPLGPVDDAAALWRARNAAAVAPCYHRYSDLVVERAEGSHLFTVDGRDVLDFGSGISVTNLGHLHPEVVAAVRAQLDRVWHTSVTALSQPPIAASEALARIAPAGLDQIFFCTSGTEAVEAAIKLARKATGRADIIAFEGAFHGRTLGSLSLTSSRSRFRSGVGPLIPNVHTVAYPRDSLERTTSEMGRLFATKVDPTEVAAVFVEPVLGEGGYVIPPADLLPWLRRLCDEHGMLLVVDEVQTGLGRCGHMFAVERDGVFPDILCVAKALANGLPLGAIVASHGLMSVWSAGDHGSTFGGNPLSCAAAVAVIDVLERERLPERAARLGAAALDRMRTWIDDIGAVADVRGQGLMLALEIGGADVPDAGRFAERVRGLGLERGLLVLSCGASGNVLRVIPPLTISEVDLERGLDILEGALRELDRSSQG